jgi:hypothetical protein
LCVIFASILPGIDATFLQVVLGVAAVVLANAAISRGGFGPASAAGRSALFFGFLITTLMWLYDGYSDKSPSTAASA